MNPKNRASLLLATTALLLTACGGASGDAGAPKAPSALSGAEMGSGFHLTWTDNSSDEEEFVVERQVGSGSFAELARVPFNTTQFMVESGEAGQHLVFRVRARGAAGLSAPSNDVMWMP